MSDEEKKARYRRIVKKLKSANEKMYRAKDSLASLASSLEKNITVDGNGYEVSKINSFRERVDSLQDKNINIINSLVRKINQSD